MPKIDFSTVEDVQDFTPLPKGKYRCQLVEVEEATTQSGYEMWKIRFEVTEGEFNGRFIFDNLFFSDKGLKRTKLLCNRLGLDVSGELDLTPDKIKGLACYVEVDVEEYEDSNGQTKPRNVVPFAGFHRVEEVDDLPF